MFFCVCARLCPILCSPLLLLAIRPTLTHTTRNMRATARGCRLRLQRRSKSSNALLRVTLSVYVVTTTSFSNGFRMFFFYAQRKYGGVAQYDEIAMKTQKSGLLGIRSRSWHLMRETPRNVAPYQGCQRGISSEHDFSILVLRRPKQAPARKVSCSSVSAH